MLTLSGSTPNGDGSWLTALRRSVGRGLHRVGLRDVARRAIFEEVPELVGCASAVEPDLVRHWTRVLCRSERLLGSLPPPTGPRVLFLSTLARKMAWAAPAAILAYALRLRGAAPMLAACDHWLQACEAAGVHQFPDWREYVRDGPRKLCAACHGRSAALFSALRLPTYRFSEFAREATAARVEEFLRQMPPDALYDLRYKGFSLRGPIEDTMLRLVRAHDSPVGPEHRPLWEHHARAALLHVEMLEEMFDRLSPDVIALDFGAYIARGIPLLVARARGVRASIFYRGYHPLTFQVGMDENPIAELAARGNGPWDDVVLSEERKAALLEWIGQRRAGQYFKVPVTGPEAVAAAIAADLGLDRQRPVFTLFPNLGWDSKSHYATPQYPAVLDWVFDSVEIFARRPALQLVIRVHPAELWQPPLEPMATLIRKRFPLLPSNVFLVDADRKISSYVLGEMAHAVVTYGSTIGLELAALGKPVIVAGNAPYRGKGFTYDVDTREQYCAYIDRLATGAPGDPGREERAQRFAYYLFFAREVPFLFWPRIGYSGPTPWWRLFRSLEDLLPGRDPNLDVICDHIMHGQEALAPGSV